MASTVVTITTLGTQYRLPGTSFTIENLRSQFAETCPEVTGMEHETESQENGDVHVTFRPRVGTKG